MKEEDDVLTHGIEDRGGRSDSGGGEDSDEGEDEVDEEVIKSLEEALCAAPQADASAHVTLIQSLRLTGDLQRLRKARERFADNFVVPPKIWEEWIQDEMNVAGKSVDSRKKVDALCERALQCLPTATIWKLRVKVAEGLGGDEQQLNALVKEAHSAMGSDVVDGHFFLNKLVEMSRRNEGEGTAELENALLAVSKAPVQNVDRLAAVEELEAMKSPQAIAARDSLALADDVLGQLVAHEVDILKNSSDSDKQKTAWNKYLLAVHALMKKTKVVRSLSMDGVLRTLHQRYVAERHTDPQAWQLYIFFLANISQDRTIQSNAVGIALRCCPNSSALWKAQLQSLEFQENLEFGSLIQQVGMLVHCALQRSFDSVDDTISIILVSCDVYRRFALRTEPPLVDVQSHIVAHFDYAMSAAKSLPSLSSGAFSKLARAYCETMVDPLVFPETFSSKETHEKVFNILEMAMDTFPDNYQIIQQTIQVLLQIGRMDRCRIVVKQRLHSLRSAEANSAQKSNAARKLAAKWLDLESRYGTLETLGDAQKAVGLFVILQGADEMEYTEASAKEKSKKQTNKKQNRKSGQDEKLKKRKAEFLSKDTDSSMISDDEYETAVGQSKRQKTSPSQQTENNDLVNPSQVKEETQATKKKREKKKEISKPPSKQERSIFVTNLPYEADEAKIAAHFELNLGPVERVELKKGKTGNSKGSAVIVYQNADCASQALIEKDSSLLLGRALEVRPFSKTAQNTQEQHDDGRIEFESDPNLAFRSIYIGKVPPQHCSEEEICAGEHPFFVSIRHCGTIESVKVARNRASAVVRFDKKESAAMALELHGNEFLWEDANDGKPINVHVERMKTPYTTAVTSGPKISSKSKSSASKIPETSRKSRIGLMPRSLLSAHAKKSEKGSEGEDSGKTQEETETVKPAEQKAENSGMKSNAYFASLFTTKKS